MSRRIGIRFVRPILVVVKVRIKAGPFMCTGFPNGGLIWRRSALGGSIPHKKKPTYKATPEMEPIQNTPDAVEPVTLYYCYLALSEESFRRCPDIRGLTPLAEVTVVWA